MSAQTYLSEETIVRRGVEALLEALGPVEANRFLALPRSRLNDYVEWHRHWQSGLDVQTFLDEVFGQSRETESRRGTSPFTQPE